MSTGNVRLALRWALWFGILGAATAVLVWARGDIDQSHAALTLLLIVLGGSAGGGRPLGFALALVSFILIDYYFQPPYNLISVGKALDWVVLVAFVAAAFVATELMTQARTEAETARQRTAEVLSLSRLGSETLRYDRPQDALSAVAELVRRSLDAHSTSIRLWDESTGLSAAPAAVAGDAPGTAEIRATDAVVLAARQGEGLSAAVRGDGRIVRGALDDIASDANVRSVVLPLLVETRLVGVLTVSAGEARSLHLPPSQRRFLTAIGYYAALGAERVRLAGEAAMARELREANSAKDEVLASVSHDLRTPLTTIKLLAQAAAGRGEPSAPAIEEQADRLAQLVTNVLDLSRLRAGGVPSDIELNTAEDLIGAVINRAEGIMHGRRVVTHVDLGEPVLAGRFDFVQSLRIVGNLFDNAIRHSPPDGVVELSSYREGQYLVVSVADHGPGVAPAERERIFDAFYRPRSEAPDAGHAGLGLSIARQLAELQGGTLTYEPNDGGGSRFILRLPFAEFSASVLDSEEPAAAGSAD